MAVNTFPYHDQTPHSPFPTPDDKTAGPPSSVLRAGSRVGIKLDIPVVVPSTRANLVVRKVPAVVAVVQSPLHGRVAVLLETAHVVAAERREAGSRALVLHHEDDIVREALVAEGDIVTPLDLERRAS